MFDTHVLNAINKLTSEAESGKGQEDGDSARSRELKLGADYLQVISRLYIYNSIKELRSKYHTNNPNERESKLFDFLLNISYPAGMDIQELDNIIDSIAACCSYLQSRDPRFYNSPFRVNHLATTNTSLRLNSPSSQTSGSGSNIFASLLDDNKILHSFIMSLNDINRSIKNICESNRRLSLVEEEAATPTVNKQASFSEPAEHARLRKNRSSLSLSISSTLYTASSSSSPVDTTKRNYSLLSKICAILQLLSSCSMEMYKCNRLHLVKALVQAFNRIIVEEEEFVLWFYNDGISSLKKLYYSNYGRFRKRTERAMQTLLPKSTILQISKFISSSHQSKTDLITSLRQIRFDVNWQAVYIVFSAALILHFLINDVLKHLQ